MFCLQQQEGSSVVEILILSQGLFKDDVASIAQIDA